MALVLLPGLNNLIEDISEEKKLPSQIVEAALREALLKGYERYRRTLYLGISEDPFEEDYFSNFDVGLDLEEEGYRVLASKIIVEEGYGLNPLLQDPGLAFHPPFLYLGYVGLSIVWSFALAGLIRNTINKEWARNIRVWALTSWVFLTVGISLGSWWAYYE